jgi:hypothetical protein
MSMAKRASATAEAAADLDMVEDAIGTEEENAERFTTTHLLIGMLGAVLLLLVGIVAFAALAGGSDTNYSMLPDGYRASTGLDPAYQGNGRSALTSAPRSPFPSAQQAEPIILEVTCPSDTVHIATGENVADTLCVRGVLVEDANATPTPETVQIIVEPPAPTASLCAPPAFYSEALTHCVNPDDSLPCADGHVNVDGRCALPVTPTVEPSTIGGTLVPDGLDCEEDEGIAFRGVPDTLFCVHIEPAPVTLPPSGGESPR